MTTPVEESGKRAHRHLALVGKECPGRAFIEHELGVVWPAVVRFPRRALCQEYDRKLSGGGESSP